MVNFAKSGHTAPNRVGHVHRDKCLWACHSGKIANKILQPERWNI